MRKGTEFFNYVGVQIPPPSSESKRNNPRQIFIDFANSVRSAAWRGRENLRSITWTKENISKVDQTTDELSHIIGECEAMLNILNAVDR